MIEQAQSVWFMEWFNTPYYHMLYRHRNMAEAEVFLKKLHQILPLPQEALVLDLACGKGRHAYTLSNLGYTVWGTDLSDESIAEAQKLTIAHSAKLFFEVRDMREVYKPAFFDAVFNLFTSFGYFDDPIDDVRVMRAVADNLKPNGLFVFDFLNINHVQSAFKPAETQLIEGVEFVITRQITNGVLLKSISVRDNGQAFSFEERVRAYTPEALRALLEATGFKILQTFGNYLLEPSDALHADRVIFVAQKQDKWSK